MTQGNPYSVTKLAHHPDYIAAFRDGRVLAPVQIHLMWQNLCQADCNFCAYRLSNWKNSNLFDDKQAIPWLILEPMLREAHAMGTKAIELTGGGEPTIYPHYDRGVELIHELGFDLGIVTNGVALSAARVMQLQGVRGWKWARVSIDAGSPGTYCEVRRVSPIQWDRAWAAIVNLAHARDDRGDTEIRVGAGFVVTNENAHEVYTFCEKAKRAGADNVRLSVRFGPGGNDYYNPDVLDMAEQQAADAQRDLDDDRFLVVNLIPERRLNQDAPTQDYEPCHTMRLLCVIGGDSAIYTCCTLAFDPRGRIGSLREHSFKELWAGAVGQKFFESFKVRERCTVQCLYEKRNKAMIEIMQAPSFTPNSPAPPHVNFV